MNKEYYFFNSVLPRKEKVDYTEIMMYIVASCIVVFISSMYI